MSDVLDPNKLVAEFANSNMNRIVDSVAHGMKGTRNRVRAKLDRTYRNYLSRILDRYSNAKSFFIRTEPTPLYEFFVPLDLLTEQRTLTKPGAPDVAAVASAAIVTGSGGCGKTMLMRHFLSEHH